MDATQKESCNVRLVDLKIFCSFFKYKSTNVWCFITRGWLRAIFKTTGINKADLAISHVRHPAWP